MPHGLTRDQWVKSLAPGKFEWNFRHLIFQIISVLDGWGISCELALRWMSLDLTDDKSTLVQVMAWCRQATSHYLSQCWLRSLSPYGVTRPQWVNCLWNGSLSILYIPVVVAVSWQPFLHLSAVSWGLFWTGVHRRPWKWHGIIIIPLNLLHCFQETNKLMKLSHFI